MILRFSVLLASPLELGLHQHIFILLGRMLPAQILLHASLLQAPATNRTHKRRRRRQKGRPKLAASHCFALLAIDFMNVASNQASTPGKCIMSAATAGVPT